MNQNKDTKSIANRYTSLLYKLISEIINVNENSSQEKRDFIVKILKSFNDYEEIFYNNLSTLHIGESVYYDPDIKEFTKNCKEMFKSVKNKERKEVVNMLSVLINSNKFKIVKRVNKIEIRRYPLDITSWNENGFYVTYNIVDKEYVRSVLSSLLKLVDSLKKVESFKKNFLTSDCAVETEFKNFEKRFVFTIYVKPIVSKFYNSLTKSYSIIICE